MDPETKNRWLKTCSLMISTVNLALLIFVSVLTFHLYHDTSMIDARLILLMIMMLNITFFASILRLIYSINNLKIRDVRYCLECFIVLFILNVIPIITKTKEQSETNCKYFKNGELCTTTNFDFIWISCKFVYVMLVLEIYSTYLYYNYELKCPQQNVSPTPPIRGNPFAPTNVSQMGSTQITTQQPLENTSQPAEPNAIGQPDRNSTEQHIIHYIVQQPGNNATRQPVTSAYNPQHVVQIPQLSDQSMTTISTQDSEQPITQKSVKLSSNPPPYSKHDDM